MHLLTYLLTYLPILLRDFAKIGRVSGERGVDLSGSLLNFLVSWYGVFDNPAK